MKFRGRHLGSSPSVSSGMVVQHCHHVYGIAGPRKHRYSRWNSVAILCIQAEIYVFEVLRPLSGDSLTCDYHHQYKTSGMSEAKIGV